MPKRPHVPQLTHHKATGQGVVRLNGKDHYLGRYGEPATNQAYDQLIREWLENKRIPFGDRDHYRS